MNWSSNRRQWVTHVHNNNTLNWKDAFVDITKKYNRESGSWVLPVPLSTEAKAEGRGGETEEGG